jgi:hypothetical protein
LRVIVSASACPPNSPASTTPIHRIATSVIPSVQPSLPQKGFARIYPRMTRFFDMADHARLPWRFTRESRSVLARLI